MREPKQIVVLLKDKLLKEIIAQAKAEGFDNEPIQFSRELIKRQLKK